MISNLLTTSCLIENISIMFSSQQVSWIRKRDLHILTVGILTYTNDQRFQSLHQEGSDEWALKISSPQPRDSGTYECQVSMEPKISKAFRLMVIGMFRIDVIVSNHWRDKVSYLKHRWCLTHKFGQGASHKADFLNNLFWKWWIVRPNIILDIHCHWFVIVHKHSNLFDCHYFGIYHIQTENFKIITFYAYILNNFSSGLLSYFNFRI